MKNVENTKNTKFKEQDQFSENIKMVFFVLSKIILKNSFQKKQPNMPLVFLKLANVESMFAMIQDILYVRAMRGLAMVKKMLDFFLPFEW